MAGIDPLEALDHQIATYPGPDSRLAGLEECLTAIEGQLEHLRGQHTVRLVAKLERFKGRLDADYVEMEVHKLKEKVEQLFPKVFRGGFLISLWSVFEACIKDLAEHTRRVRGTPFSLQDLRAGDFMQQTEKFFEGVLGLEVFPDKKLRKQLEELRGFRNALAHHDGNTADLPKSPKAGTEEQYRVLGIQVYSDLHHEFAVPDDDYIRRSFSAVRTHLMGFAEQLYGLLHPEYAKALSTPLSENV